MCGALAKAVRVDEVKNIRDKSIAMRAYAKQAQDRELIGYATEIKMRAERRAGQLLMEMEKNKGGLPGRTGLKSRSVLDTAPKLRDIGVSKNQSSRWQKLADMSADRFEGIVETATGRRTSSGQWSADIAIEWLQR